MLLFYSKLKKISFFYLKCFLKYTKIDLPKKRNFVIITRCIAITCKRIYRNMEEYSILLQCNLCIPNCFCIVV